MTATATIDGMRQCKSCLEVKPETEFYLTKKGGKRRQVRCKACDSSRRPRIRTGYEPQRERVKLCKLCCSLPHRVEGEQCRVCGLEAGE